MTEDVNITKRMNSNYLAMCVNLAEGCERFKDNHEMLLKLLSYASAYVDEAISEFYKDLFVDKINEYVNRYKVINYSNKVSDS